MAQLNGELPKVAKAIATSEHNPPEMIDLIDRIEGEFGNQGGLYMCFTEPRKVAQELKRLGVTKERALALFEYVFAHNALAENKAATKELTNDVKQMIKNKTIETFVTKVAYADSEAPASTETAVDADPPKKVVKKVGRPTKAEQAQKAAGKKEATAIMATAAADDAFDALSDSSKSDVDSSALYELIVKAMDDNEKLKKKLKKFEVLLDSCIKYLPAEAFRDYYMNIKMHDRDDD